MDDREVIKMAVFKLGDAATRMRALATSTHDPSVQRLLAAVAQLLAAQQEELRAALDGGLCESSEEPQRDDTPQRRRGRPGVARRTELRLAKGGRK